MDRWKHTRNLAGPFCNMIEHLKKITTYQKINLRRSWWSFKNTMMKYWRIKMRGFLLWSESWCRTKYPSKTRNIFPILESCLRLLTELKRNSLLSKKRRKEVTDKETKTSDFQAEVTTLLFPTRKTATTILTQKTVKHATNQLSVHALNWQTKNRNRWTLKVDYRQ